MNHIADAAQLIVALTIAFNCWLTWHNGERAKKIAAGVAEIKNQTDGITARLVKVTGEAEHAKGVKQGEESVSNEPVKVEIVKIPSPDKPR